MYKYDILYPTVGQFTLEIDGTILNISKNKSYLIKKMKAHRDLMCENGYTKCVTYSIISYYGDVVYEKTFEEGQRGGANEPYHKKKKEDVTYIRKNGFNLIATSAGEILTDEDLLQYLYDFRFYNYIPVIITNDALVSMATFKPTTEEEFVVLKGLGQKTYNVCGEKFIQAIADFEKNKKEPQ